MFGTLLKLHITVSIICFVIYLIGVKAIYIRFKNKYEFTNLQKNKAEFILQFIKLIIMMFMPLMNIALACVMLFMYEKVYDTIEFKFMASGMAKLKTDIIN